MSTINESISNLMAEKREVRITLRALMLEIVLRGLRTLKTLNEFNPESPLSPD